MISSEYLTHRVVQEYPIQRKKIQFRHFWRPSWILAENEKCEYLRNSISSPLILGGRYTLRQWFCLHINSRKYLGKNGSRWITHSHRPWPQRFSCVQPTSLISFGISFKLCKWLAIAEIWPPYYFGSTGVKIMIWGVKNIKNFY